MTFDALLEDEERLRRLADRLAERIIEYLAEHLGVRSEPPEGLLSASEVAQMTGKTRRWVYDHAGDLGAVPLGTGSRPRLGFHPTRVRRYLDASVAEPRPRPAPVPYYRQHPRKQPKLSATARDLLDGRRLQD